MNYLLTSLLASEAARPANKLYSVFRFSYVTTLNRLVFDKLASISTRKPENLARNSSHVGSSFRSLGNSSIKANLLYPFALYSFSPASNALVSLKCSFLLLQCP